jgi:NAD(P)H-dependent FMN reductase
MIKVGIVLGSTRPGRKGEAVARWVFELAQQRTDASYEYVDIAEYGLPLLDEPAPASSGKYTKEHTKRWAAKIGSLDAFVFVTPEYNHGISGALKNALDFLYAEWNNKAAGFVGYGGTGALRSIEQLRLVMNELQLADVRSQTALVLRDDWENWSVFKPREHQVKSVAGVLDHVVKWGTAMKTLRG